MELQRLQSWWRLLHIANLAFIKCYLCYAMCRLQVHNILWKKKYWSWAVKVKKIVYYFFPSSWPHFWGQMNCISPFTLYCNLHTYLHNSAKWVSSSRSNLTTWLYTQACGITAGPLFGQNSQKCLANTEWNLNIILNFFIINRDS